MDLNLIEPHPRRVMEAFRRGEFDGLEIIEQADEKEFFELCLREKLLESLAESMPTAREKQEVPPWFVLAANLSLRLHDEHAFLAFERVVRCGGLLSALDPGIVSRHLDPASRHVVLSCEGFNEKNHYDRQTPCETPVRLDVLSVVAHGLFPLDKQGRRLTVVACESPGPTISIGRVPHPSLPTK